MAKKDRIDIQTGHKLRRLTHEQCETAEAIFLSMSDERHNAPEGADDAVVMENIRRWQEAKKARLAQLNPVADKWPK